MLFLKCTELPLAPHVTYWGLEGEAPCSVLDLGCGFFVGSFCLGFLGPVSSASRLIHVLKTKCHGFIIALKRLLEENIPSKICTWLFLQFWLSTIFSAAD